MPSGRPINHEKRSAIVSLVRKGRFTLSQVGAQTGVSTTTVRKIERSIGVECPRERIRRVD